MQRIDSPGAVATLPVPATSLVTPGYFAQISTSGGNLTPTIVSADYLNAVQEEIVAVIAGAGITLNKAVTNQLYTAITSLIGTSARMKLTSNLNVYVATSGSDTANTGMTSGSPFATIQAAVNLVYKGGYDFNGHSGIINIANGTYTAPVNVYGMPVGHSSGPVQFIGNSASPGSVLVTVASGNAWTHNIGSWALLSGITVAAGGTSTAYTGSGYGLVVASGCYVQVHNCGFAACTTAQITVQNGGVVTMDFLPSSFTGTSPYGLNAATGGMIWVYNSTLTFTSPTYTGAFANVSNGGVLVFGGNTFTGSGTVTGSKYSASFNGMINLGGMTLPGSTAGSTSLGGQVA